MNIWAYIERLEVLIFLSIAGGIAILALPLYSVPPVFFNESFEFILFVVSFEISCIIGIAYAINPASVLYIIGVHAVDAEHKKVRYVLSDKRHPCGVAHTIVGHHPDCGRFQAHTIKIFGIHKCSGCVGLAAGGVVSMFLILIIVWQSIVWESPAIALFQQTIPLLTPLGIILVSIGFADGFLRNRGISNSQKKHGYRSPVLHAVANSFYPIGFTLSCGGVMLGTGSGFLALLSLSVCISWLYTRTVLSRLNHQTVCIRCQFLELPRMRRHHKH